MGLCIFVPVGILESISTFKVGYNAAIQLAAGYWFVGNPIAIIQAITFGAACVEKGLNFSTDMKLAHYFKVPPRIAFSVQLAGAIFGSVTNVGVVDWALGNIPHICTSAAKDNLVCRYSQTQFNTNVVYGVIGPSRLFDTGDYKAILWFFLIGAVTPIPVYFAKQRFSTNRFVSEFSVPLFFSGASNIPSVTGINYSTWAIVGYVFNYLIHKKKNPWWRKYNFTLSAALDTGTDLSAIIIYFCVTFPGGAVRWWGTEVQNSGCDSKGCPNKTLQQ